jgi:hypothetical protein
MTGSPFLDMVWPLQILFLNDILEVEDYASTLYISCSCTVWCRPEAQPRSGGRGRG